MKLANSHYIDIPPNY